MTRHPCEVCDKLGIEHRIAAEYPGAKGWIFKKVIDYLVAQGEKGLTQPA